MALIKFNSNYIIYILQMNTNKYINTYTVFYLILLFQIIVDLFFTKETKDCIINKINFIDKLTFVNYIITSFL